MLTCGSVSKRRRNSRIRSSASAIGMPATFTLQPSAWAAWTRTEASESLSQAEQDATRTRAEAREDANRIRSEAGELLSAARAEGLDDAAPAPDVREEPAPHA